MREMTLDEVKRVQLEVLDAVMSFCKANGINCWLNGGTLLGAVRHKGYIPWDDDIDLGMLRPDFDRFIATFNDDNPRYKLICCENDPNTLFHYGKVIDTSTYLYEVTEKSEKLGVNIDIFICDNAPDNKTEQTRMFRKRDLYNVCNLGRRFPVFTKPLRGGLLRSLAVYAFRAVLRVFPRQYFTKKLDENAKSYTGHDTGLVGNFTGIQRTVCKRSLFEKVTELEFEGKMYPAPIGWDEWLTGLYGDYMTPPPPEARTSSHHYKAYWKD